MSNSVSIGQKNILRTMLMHENNTMERRFVFFKINWWTGCMLHIDKDRKYEVKLSRKNICELAVIRIIIIIIRIHTHTNSRNCIQHSQTSTINNCVLFILASEWLIGVKCSQLSLIIDAVLYFPSFISIIRLWFPYIFFCFVFANYSIGPMCRGGWAREDFCSIWFLRKVTE